MAIIYSYPINTNILATDIIVGSSTVLVGGRPKNQTKSFEIQDLAAYFASAILPPGSYVPYTGAVGSVNLGIHNLTAASIIKAGGTNLQYLMADGSISTGTFVPAAALTKTDDTNVTLTLGGSPATALLAATSLTLGWSGTLADSRITSAAIWNAKQDAITLTTLGTSGAATFIANTLNIPSYVDQFVGTVTSVGLTAPSAFTITGSPITTSGTLAITGAGLVSQYIDGTGALQTFPALSSGTVTNIATAGLISGGAITTTGTITTLMATNRLVGRGTALSGVMEEIILGTNLSLTGTTLNAVNSGGTVTSVTATTPVLSTGGTTPVISMPLGTSSVDGYLSAADRTNFETAYTNRITSLTTTGTGAATLVANVLNIPTPALTGFVPYTGATQAVNLGAFDLTVNSAIIGRGGGQVFNNTMFGISNGINNVSGSYNTSIGFNVGVDNVSGSYNSALGVSALQLSTTGASNMAFGVFALYANTTGSFNTAVGTTALSTNTTGSNNVGIGINTQTLNPTDNNSIMIGESVTGAGSNTVVIGNGSITTTRLRGTVQGLYFVKDTGTVYQTLRADGSVTTDGTLYKVTSTSYSIVSGSSFFFSAAIPSNIFADGDNLKINTITGTTAIAVSAVIMRYYINTTPGLPGAIQIANWSGNLGSISYPMDRVYWVNGGNFYARNFTSSSPSSTNTGTAAINSTPIPLGPFYIIVEIVTTAPDLAGLLNFQIIKS